MEDTAVEIYCKLFQFHQARTVEFSENDNWLFCLRNRNSDRKMSLVEVATILMLYQQSSCPSFKMFQKLTNPWLSRLFPKMLSYARLSYWFGKLEPFLADYAHSTLPKAPKQALFLIDSTKIDPHRAKNHPKILAKKVGCGYTHEGLFIGLKLHALVDRKARLMAFDLTTGNVNDLAPIKGGLLDGFQGVIYADSGYTSAFYRETLKQKNITFIAKPKRTMEFETEAFNLKWAKPYRQRQIVEGFFKVLKHSCGLLSHSTRSVRSFKSRIYASLCLYSLFCAV